MRLAETPSLVDPEGRSHKGFCWREKSQSGYFNVLACSNRLNVVVKSAKLEPINAIHATLLSLRETVPTFPPQVSDEAPKAYGNLHNGQRRLELYYV